MDRSRNKGHSFGGIKNFELEKFAQKMRDMRNMQTHANTQICVKNVWKKNLLRQSPPFFAYQYKTKFEFYSSVIIQIQKDFTFELKSKEKASKSFFHDKFI